MEKYIMTYDIWTYSLASVFVVSLISFVGVFTLSINKAKLEKILLYIVSFSAGALFGDVFIHLIPEMSRDTGFTLAAGLYIILGILGSFVIEKAVRWKHHHHHLCGHKHHHSKHHTEPFAIMNLIGDGVHNLLDGIIIGVSYAISLPVGFATTLAVIAHEIPQEIGDFGVLLHGGFSRVKALFFNFLSGLTAVLGAVIALFLQSSIANINSVLVPLAIGGFIYIAGSDLIPELHKEVDVQSSTWQVIAFVLGVLVMMALLLLD
jgi:zinc and cadmium transporter